VKLAVKDADRFLANPEGMCPGLSPSDSAWVAETESSHPRSSGQLQQVSEPAQSPSPKLSAQASQSLEQVAQSSSRTSHTPSPQAPGQARTPLWLTPMNRCGATKGYQSGR